MTGFLLASDLDRTLIHPARTLPANRVGEVVEHLRGEALTVASAATLAALGEIAAAGAFIPVTTRSREQLKRIVPIWALARSAVAICANGATVLRNGRPDPHWDAEVVQRSRATASLAEVRDAIVVGLGSPETVDWMALLRDCDGYFLYATLDLARAPKTLAEDARALLAPFGWRAVLHTKKLYALPSSICKGAAIDYVLEGLPTQHLMAAGDSELDIELLQAAGDRWCPAGSELVVRGRVPPDTTVTRGRHVQAGTEIAEHALRRLRASRS